MTVGDKVRMGNQTGTITGSMEGYWRVATKVGNDIRHEWWWKSDCELESEGEG